MRHIFVQSVSKYEAIKVCKTMVNLKGSRVMVPKMLTHLRWNEQFCRIEEFKRVKNAYP